jgi:histidine phosphotransfer protein HptB
MMPSNEPLRSQLANDPEMTELIEMFLSDLTGRVDSLNTYFEAGNFNGIRTLAHQLRGASAGYGYPEIGLSAAVLEDQVKPENHPTPDAAAVEKQLKELVELCNRAIAGRG